MIESGAGKGVEGIAVVGEPLKNYTDQQRDTRVLSESGILGL
jgi:hypothetical protein